MEYFTSGDIANRLGVSKPTVSNWLARGYVEKGQLPEPEFVTVSGMSIWTTQQVEQIERDYLERKKLEAQISELRAQIKKLKGK